MNLFSSHKARLNRFLGADGRCLDVAIDHGDLLQSIPDPRKPALVLRTDVGNLYNSTPRGGGCAP